MQNNNTVSRTSDPDQRVINYRPERVGFEFRRPEEHVVTPILPVPTVLAPVKMPIIDKPLVRDAYEEDKKPFTLGHAVIISVGILVILVTGYLAYAAWPK